MEKLKLPFFKESMLPPRSLSMDDYLKFVIMNLKYTVDIDTVRKVKRDLAVNVPFEL